MKAGLCFLRSVRELPEGVARKGAGRLIVFLLLPYDRICLHMGVSLLQALLVLANGSGPVSTYQYHLLGCYTAEAEYESQKRTQRRMSHCGSSGILDLQN